MTKFEGKKFRQKLLFYFSEILKHYLILKFLKTIEPQSGGRNVEAGILCNHSITIISLRIDYKILLLTFKCIYGLAPTIVNGGDWL